MGGSATNAGHYDQNQNASILGVIGTLGTADERGTALTLPYGVDPTTGAMYTIELGTNSGGGGGSNVNIYTGTQQVAGTVLGGTIQNLNNGSITVLNPVTAVTVGTIPQISVGTLPSVTLVNPGTIVNIATGTQQTLGTVGSVNGVAVISALTNGSVNILTGTLNALASGTLTGGTLQNLVSGTFNVGTVSITTGTVGGAAANAAAASGNPNPVGGTDSGGTIRTILVDSTGVQRSSGTMVLSVGTITTGTVQNLVSGTINALASGTITAGTLTNLVSGTINALAAGTITGGTLGNLNNGTLALVTALSTLGTMQLGTMKLDPTTIPQMVQFGTLGTAGGSFFATISAASGAGTKHYVQGVDVVLQSGTADVRILAGSSIQGTGVLAAGQFVPSAGVSKNWFPHFQTGTNSEILYHFVGAGTAFITVSYWKGI